jgi:glycosyltransferase involved in cell wall biosynthesis
MILTIGILSLTNRKPSLAKLMERLNPQLNSSVEVITKVDGGQKTRAQKRNEVIDEARGKHLCFIDDDDLVAENYVAKLLEALSSDPDAVGFKVRRFENGVQKGEAIHSMQYAEYKDWYRGTWRVYHRPINHLCPCRTTAAQIVRFRDEDGEMEDIGYARRMRDFVKSEVLIDEFLYDYLYLMPQTDERKFEAAMIAAVRITPDLQLKIDEAKEQWVARGSPKSRGCGCNRNA